jgi:hypothetical protein
VKRRRKPFAFERLESRLTFAGNVTANVVGEDLIVVGDDLANSLTLGQSGPGSFILFGENNANPHDTLINGKGTTTGVVFNGVTGSVVIDLGAGDDRFQTDFQSTSIEIGKALVLDAGSGNDAFFYVGLRSLRVGTQLVANLGDGHDRFISVFTTVGTDHIVHGGPGNDYVLVQVGTARNVAIHTGDGFDSARVLSFRVGNCLLLDGGNGGDLLEISDVTLFNDTAIFGRAGGDAIYVNRCNAAKSLLINGGSDFGYLEIQKWSWLKGSTYLINEGPTQINVDSSVLTRLEILVGPGSDLVSIRRCSVDALFASLGQGNDGFTLIATRVSQGGRIDGQGGFDVFAQGDNVVANLEVADFVFFPPPQSLTAQSA